MSGSGLSLKCPQGQVLAGTKAKNNYRCINPQQSKLGGWQRTLQTTIEDAGKLLPGGRGQPHPAPDPKEFQTLAKKVDKTWQQINDSYRNNWQYPPPNIPSALNTDKNSPTPGSTKNWGTEFVETVRKAWDEWQARKAHQYGSK